ELSDQEETRAGGDACRSTTRREQGSSGLGHYAGWLDEMDGEIGILANNDLPIIGMLGPCDGADEVEDTRAGSLEYRAPTARAKEEAREYIELARQGGPGSPKEWAELCRKGGELVKEAGSVKLAAESLWEVREEQGWNHLCGVANPYLDTILHPDLLEYLRDVRQRGLAARYVGKRERCSAKIHPNGRRNLGQVYRQIWKDMVKLRVLVVPSNLEEMGPVISSPFDAVDKMLPDRSVAPDKRIVHDQRVINCGTDKEWHPPAIQPKHEQVARLILHAKAHLPNTEILMSKKDVAGAFRLLWVDPHDADLFAGDLPWVPEEMEKGEETAEGVDMTVVYLVNLSWAFQSRILVDDNVLIEPWVGLRPWVAGEVYEAGVTTLLGKAAVNRDKDMIEGPFRTFQTVWGLDMETASEEIHLPERRILKGANLLCEPAFEYGSKDITVRAIQRFRGIATGWTVIVRGLKNELKAADRFLGLEHDGSAKARPKVRPTRRRPRAWRDLWELFEEVRWLCARPDTWPTKFGASLRELLPVRERLALAGEWEAGTVFVSSDATKTVIGAIDWTNGLVMRMPDEVAIHVAEMLSFLAFACHVGHLWSGKAVLYGGDNQIVRSWIGERKAGTAVGRLLVRIVNLLEMRFRFALIPAWWRTYHNVHADYVTRCTEGEFQELVEHQKWTIVDVRDSLRQAAIDSERFGPCLLAWGDEDRQVLMQLKERRLSRSVPHALRPDWNQLRFVELCGPSRLVTDFVDAVEAAGSKARRAALWGPVEPGEIVMTSLPPDVHGKVVEAVFKASVDGEALLLVMEGPRGVAWDRALTLAERAGWSAELCEYVTTEFGEVAARRRRCIVASAQVEVKGSFGATTCRSKHPGAPHERQVERHPERTLLGEWGKGKLGEHWRAAAVEVWACQGRSMEHWGQLVEEGVEPDTILIEGARATGAQTASALSLMAAYLCGASTRAGAAWDSVDDANMTKLLRWLRQWKRGLFPRADEESMGRRAGGGNDEDEEAGRCEELLAAQSPPLLPEGPVLPLPTEAHHVHDPELRAGQVWHWGEALWLSDSSDAEGEGDDLRSARHAAGASRRRSERATVAQGEAQVADVPDQVRPFNGDVGMCVDEWVDENLCGYLAESTTKQYAGVYGKWKAWARRQGWATEFLDKSVATEENENKLLGFLGYLGWLGASPATLKQAVFAIKDGHKRHGQGDPTDKMFRLWMLLGALDKRTPKKPRRLGVTPEMLRWITATLDTKECGSAQEKFDALMLKAAVLMAWFFMLRAKEYCESDGVDYAMVLRGADIKFLDSDPKEGRKGVTMQFRKTKTDQEAYGTFVRGRSPPRVPEHGTKTFWDWTRGAATFVSMVRGSDAQELLQRAAQGIGLPPERFRSHSLRIGGASALFQATGEIELVKRTGRWSSSAVQRYLHDGEVALKGVASKMASVEQKIHYT
ncbi:unnamed protein product, partial [Symbiodinium necroappetens]